MNYEKHNLFIYFVDVDISTVLFPHHTECVCKLIRYYIVWSCYRSFSSCLDLYDKLLQICFRYASSVKYLLLTCGSSGFLWGWCSSIFSFLCSVLQIIVRLFTIILSVLLPLITASEYHFDIFKLLFLGIMHS